MTKTGVRRELRPNVHPVKPHLTNQLNSITRGG